MIKRELNILIVEDEVITAMILKINLEKAGYHVARSVVSGEDAVLAVQELNMDVVLMDIRLAGSLDGIQAAALIQDIRKTPIIFCSGYDDNATKKRADALNPLGFLTKPLDLATMIRTLDLV